MNKSFLLHVLLGLLLPLGLSVALLGLADLYASGSLLPGLLAFGAGAFLFTFGFRRVMKAFRQLRRLERESRTVKDSTELTVK